MIDVKTLHAKIGELTLENDFFRRARQGGSVAERKKMIDSTEKLSVNRQAIVLGISRGSVYYQAPVDSGSLLRFTIRGSVWSRRRVAITSGFLGYVP